MPAVVDAHVLAVRIGNEKGLCLCRHPGYWQGPRTPSERPSRVGSVLDNVDNALDNVVHKEPTRIVISNRILEPGERKHAERALDLLRGNRYS